MEKNTTTIEKKFSIVFVATREYIKYERTKTMKRAKNSQSQGVKTHGPSKDEGRYEAFTD